MSRKLRWTAGIVAGLVVLMSVLSYLVDIPLRKYLEDEMNRKLKGYRVRIVKAEFHPVGFSLDLKNLEIQQIANPSPSVAVIVRLHASVHWSEFFRGHLVADFTVERPRIYINRKNILSEQKSKIPVKKEGWQDAFESIYPLKINEFTIRNGDLTYIDEEPSRPLTLRSVNFEAHNIRNIRYPDRVYPSPISFTGTIFGSGKMQMNGDANFLLEPFAGIKAVMSIQDMDLGFFKPVAARHNISMEKGALSAKGSVEFSPRIRVYRLDTVEIKGAEINYVHLPETAGAEKEAAAKAGETAKELSNKPSTLIKIDRFKISDCNFGFINRTRRPNYRVYVSDLSVDIKNFSNHFSQGPATVLLKGKFMGSGKSIASGTFRPEKKGPDFNIKIAIRDTSMPAMNDLFRAYGKFDVAAGLFSFYSELTVRKGTVDGYVKPLFRHMKVYDKRKDREKSLFHKLYEKLIGGVATLLENRSRKEVATEARVKGSVESPRASTWQVLVRLVQNAFFRAILPGFEENIGK